MEKLIIENLELWTGAITQKSASGRGSSSKRELTGIKKLRELILELAVRGKLVPQIASEGTGSDVLTGMCEQKADLINQGLLKRSKAGPKPNQIEKPFQLPSSWAWATLPMVSQYGPGKTPPTKNARFWADASDGHAWVSIADMDHYGSVSKTARCISDAAATEVFKAEPVPAGAILMSFKLTVGKVAINQVPVYHNEAIISIFPLRGIDREYLFKALPLLAASGDSKSAIKGNTLNAQSIAAILVPVPPLAEQHRIVQKVDELMALCDQLEQQSSESIEAHERLVDTLLDTLTRAANATELAENWARVAQHFDTLFTTEHSIDRLKQTILQLAVMGRLTTPDLRNAASARLVMELFEVKDRRLVDEGMKTSAALDVPRDERYIDVPSSWSWVRLGNIAKFIDYRGRTPKKTAAGRRLVTAKNVRNWGIDLEPEEFIAEEDYLPWMTRGFPRRGDVLFTTEAPLGKVAPIEIEPDFALAQRVICFQWHLPDISPFMVLQLLAEPFQSQLVEKASGMTATGIKSAKLKEIPVALPSLEEQLRIVAIVENLFEICDALANGVANTRVTEARLAESVVDRAVAA